MQASTGGEFKGCFFQKAHVPRKKLEFYLLSETHAVGKSKAKLFRSIGYDETNIDLLEQDLLNICQVHEIAEAVNSPHGKKYVIDGPLRGPTGKIIPVRTIWIVDTGGIEPRFVTAYPSEK